MILIVLKIVVVQLEIFIECDCTDGIDNDGNGQTDCADTLCTFLDPACQGGSTAETDCTNALDDDGDGAVDCDDSDCSSDANCLIMGDEFARMMETTTVMVTLIAMIQIVLIILVVTPTIHWWTLQNVIVRMGLITTPMV